MSVKVQGDNGKYGCGIGVAQQGFEFFLPTIRVAGSTPALATNATQVALDCKTIKGACPLWLNAGKKRWME